ncbi:MAG TPA: nuclear transport factor 2 family protein [Streptomyces sp.]|uniref:nuclear transport factor 2 family protein n=1 Tax=Streptomyces sp. TaxID=1931 RepID=UPI002D0B43B2|nr:nuclear transport factor 2 family protein [Streptomyces sp.]HWU09129.1 nuclear transport factor 2 family protein [Streptomyces sp.]
MPGSAGAAWGTAEVCAAVERYWAAAEARDWDAFTAILADDVVYDLPQSRERILGKERHVRFNREGPGGRHARIERIVADGEGRRAAVRTLVTIGPDEIPAVHFFTCDADGRITGVTGFWPEPYAPSAGREHLTGRH